jgi:hypothetical protein
VAVDRGRRGGIGGISLGGILVIIGIIVAVFWSLWLGIIIALIGLIAFGGFARGRWYKLRGRNDVRRLVDQRVSPSNRKAKTALCS